MVMINVINLIRLFEISVNGIEVNKFHFNNDNNT